MSQRGRGRQNLPGGGDGGRGRGRGRGRGDFGGRGHAPSGRLEDALASGLSLATEGTAGRPGRQITFSTKETAERQMASIEKSYPKDIQEIMVLPPAKSPAKGTKGLSLRIKVNHFLVTCTAKDAMQYNLEFEPIRRAPTEDAAAPSSLPKRPQKDPPKDVLRVVVATLAKQERWPAGWAYDGEKSIYTVSAMLPQEMNSYQVQITDPETSRAREFRVKISLVQKISIAELLEYCRSKTSVAMLPQAAIQAMDVAFKHRTIMNPALLTIARGRSGIYDADNQRKISLGGGAEVWTGYKQSLRAGDGMLTLNVDMSCTAFLEEDPVPKYLARAANLPNESGLANIKPGDRYFKKAEKAIARLKVQVTHTGDNKRTYRVQGLTKEGASAFKFFNEQAEREMTVAEYYLEQYNVRLQYPTAPCLTVNSRKSVVLPIEVCKIAKGQRRLKLDDKQTAQMIKTAAQKPQDRMKFIERAVTEQAQLQTDPTVKAMGLIVDPKMMEIKARVLQAPGLQYSCPMPAPKNGAWNLMGNARFFNGAGFDSYAIVSLKPEFRVGRLGDPGSVMSFIVELISKLRSLGMTTPDPSNLPRVAFHDPNSHVGDTVLRAVEMGGKHFNVKPKIIFVALDLASPLYPDVKRATDSFLGIPSQCISSPKTGIGARGQPSDQYLSNVAMKINAKLAGVNCIINRSLRFNWQMKPYMVLGADVTHARGFNTGEPSIAAVCGTMDSDGCIFATRISVQAHRVEVIQELKLSVTSLLIDFYKKNSKKKPERLIFYRDGVSEGQFAEVQRSEVSQILAACRELGASSGQDYAPTISFIVVQKRHNTRLFPLSPRDADKSGNCLPGTVVDTDIVSPQTFSFFLNSHSGIQGTSRAALYTLLYDRNRFGADELQAFTYNYCYTYARCTRSVGLVPPAYYAHLAAARGRCMLSGWEDVSDSGSIVSQGSQSSTSTAEFAAIHADLTARMFYI